MGHAHSKRRISAEAEPRPPTPPLPRSAPAPPPIAIPSLTLITYTLPFTANLICTDEAMPSEKLQLRGRHELEDANWGEYLYATMRDASVPKYSSEKGKHVDMEDWDVTISSSVTQQKDPKGFFYTVYSGTLTWTSLSCPLERVQEEIDWRIGDRMSMYEIDDDDWHVYIEPGTVSVA